MRVGMSILCCILCFSEGVCQSNAPTLMEVSYLTNGASLFGYTPKSGLPPHFSAAMLGKTDLDAFVKLCGGGCSVSYFTQQQPIIVRDGDQTRLIVTNCEEMQICSLRHPIKAIVKSGVLSLTSTQKLAKDVSRISIRDNDKSLTGRGKTTYMEIDPLGKVVSKEGYGDITQFGNERVGHIYPSNYQIFCETLEIMGIRWMRNSDAECMGGVWREVHIQRGTHEQVIIWPRSVENRDGDYNESVNPDAKYGGISLLLDGLVSTIKWEAQSGLAQKVTPK